MYLAEQFIVFPQPFLKSYTTNYAPDNEAPGGGEKSGVPCRWHRARSFGTKSGFATSSIAHTTNCRWCIYSEVDFQFIDKSQGSRWNLTQNSGRLNDIRILRGNTCMILEEFLEFTGCILLTSLQFRRFLPAGKKVISN